MKSYESTILINYDEVSSSDIQGKVLHKDISENDVVFFADSYNHRYTTVKSKQKEYKKIPLYIFQYSKISPELLVSKTLDYFKFNDFQILSIEEISFNTIFEYDDIPITYNKKIQNYGELHELLYFYKGNSDFIFDSIQKAKSSKKELIDKSKNTLHSLSLKKEIQNIFTCKTNINYIVEGLLDNNYKKSIEVLSETLAVARQASEHIYELDFDYLTCGNNKFHRSEEFIDMINYNFTNVLSGSTVVIKYGIHDNISGFNQSSYQPFEKFLSLIKEYNDTQLIFVIPANRDFLIKKIITLIDKPCHVLSKDPSTKKDKKETYKPKQYNKLLPFYKNDIEVYNSIYKNDCESQSLKELDEMIGLESVKTKIKNIISKHVINKELERNEINTINSSLHMIFSGAAGTGKTQCAILAGKIFKESGLLKSERVIYKSCGHWFDVNSVFSQASGGILFLDEAYMLINYPAMLTDILTNMEHYRNDTIVIFALYDSALPHLLAANPGLKSRIGSIINFPNYNSEELFAIYKLFIEKNNLILTKAAESKARDMFNRNGNKPDMGNARYSRKLFEQTVENQLVRLGNTSNRKFSKRQLKTICVCDIPYRATNKKDSSYLKLNNLIGLDNIKKIIKSRINYLKIQKIKRDNGLKAQSQLGNYVFLGPPGTSKSTVALLFSEILRDENILNVGDVYYLKQSDLSSPYRGGSSKKIDSLFENARGSIIFADELYSLRNDDEALTALVDNLERWKDEVIFIGAGYKDDIIKLFNKNQGLASRLSNQIEFKDYSLNELYDIVLYLAKENDLIVDASAKCTIIKILKEAMTNKLFGNGRFCRELVNRAALKQADRLVKVKNPSIQELKTLSKEDFEVSNKISEENRLGFVP